MAVPPPVTLPSPDTDKTALRRELRRRRHALVDGLDEAGRGLALALIAGHVLPRLGDATAIAGYVAVSSEVDPLPILIHAYEQGRTVALPYVESREAPLRFLRWTPDAPLHPGPYGLSQPAQEAIPVTPDLILTPLVGFDRQGNRLGQGAGHYDRAFAALPHAHRIGLAWACQEVATLPVDPWDAPLDGIATECEWIGRDD